MDVAKEVGDGQDLEMDERSPCFVVIKGGSTTTSEHVENSYSTFSTTARFLLALKNSLKGTQRQPFHTVVQPAHTRPSLTKTPSNNSRETIALDAEFLVAPPARHNSFRVFCGLRERPTGLPRPGQVVQDAGGTSCPRFLLPSRPFPRPFRLLAVEVRQRHGGPPRTSSPRGSAPSARSAPCFRVRSYVTRSHITSCTSSDKNVPRSMMIPERSKVRGSIGWFWLLCFLLLLRRQIHHDRRFAGRRATGRSSGGA